MAGAVTVGATLRAGWPVLVISSPIYFVSHFHRIALGVVAQDLMRAFATSSGLTQTVGNIGGLAAAAPLALLVDGIGWRGSFGFIGAVTIALTAVAVLGVRDRPDARVRPATRPLREVLAGIPALAVN